MVKCLECEGKGSKKSLTSIDWKERTTPCLHCATSGEITERHAFWIVVGSFHRTYRVARRESQRECAFKFGISPSNLSHAEMGLRLLHEKAFFEQINFVIFSSSGEDFVKAWAICAGLPSPYQRLSEIDLPTLFGNMTSEECSDCFMEWLRLFEASLQSEIDATINTGVDERISDAAYWCQWHLYEDSRNGKPEPLPVWIGTYHPSEVA